MNAVTIGVLPPELERLRTLFEQQRFTMPNALARVREDALQRFLGRGFPTSRDEQWKYTNLRRLQSRSFALAPTAPIELQHAPWISGMGHRFVFVDGHWSPTLSDLGTRPPGVTIAPLGEWLGHDADHAVAYLAEFGSEASGAFGELNTAFFRDGLVLELSADTTIDMPLYVVHLWSSDANSMMAHPRILVRAGRNSRCTLIEHYLSSGSGETFTNALTQLQLAHGASFDHYLIQEQNARSFHIAQVEARVDESARYENHNVALGSALGRTTLLTSLQGREAHVALHGLFAPSSNQHLDTYTRIDHVAPHTTSHEDYRGVADGRGRGVFNGKILVRPNAQKIDAKQSSRNLLLSATAEIDAKPELEIYANDVKCSHGATIGQLDATALFYLRSRGLSEADARAALVRAFAESVLSEMNIPQVRSYLEARLDTRFGAGRLT